MGNDIGVNMNTFGFRFLDEETLAQEIRPIRFFL
jgi:hypothetical protein